MTELHGFELLRDQDIPELNTRARLYRHVKTGAQLLSLENGDENKSFGVTFRTPPKDSTGIAHILEHSVLCGSRKYPIKEPFVQLLKGSVKTFLNALTFPDKTAYPVASTNLQDFYNLVDVYMDAVFYPRISPEVLQQEGWHYELSRLDEPMIFKGVVYNEMKGAYSSPDSLLYRASQQSLFPDTTYGVDSGGDPRAIPDLTYEQFKQFHDTLYHPSNAYIFFAGDDPPEERLRLVNDYLKDFERITPNSEIGLQSPFSAPRVVEETYAVATDAPAGKKTLHTVNWLLDEQREPEAALAMSILSFILLGTPAAPLRKALIDSGLGDDVTGGGLSGRIRQSYFSVGLKNIADEDVAKVETLIFDTLRGLAENGIDAETIAAAMNTIEFSLRENNTGSFPRGLALMFRALGTWVYDDDPLAFLSFEGPLASLKQRLAGGERVFEGLIERYFLHNNHRTTVLLRPDPEKSARDDAAERARLDAARTTMNETEVQQIIAQTQKLKLMQETPDAPEAVATIPSLKLNDLDRKIKTIPLEESSYAGATLLYHDLFTSGIVYVDLALNMHTVPANLLPYVPLFGRALVELGTEKEDFVKLTQRIGRNTGGVYPSAFTATIAPADPCSAWFLLRGKALLGQTDELLAIMRDVLLTVQLDNRERFRQVVLKRKAGMEAGLVPGGNGVVSSRLSARFNESDWADEMMGGVSYLFFLRQLLEEIDNDWPGVLAKLEQVRGYLVNRNAMLCNVTLDRGSWGSFAPHLEAFLEQFPTAPLSPAAWGVAGSFNQDGLTIPAQVNYVGKGGNLYDLGYRYHGSSAVISKYLRTSYLWEKVRVQGGAYGGGCSFSKRSGLFTFVSYRDPNLLGTLNVYDGAGDFLRKVDMTPRDLERSIIGVIGDIDGYQLPDAKGYTSMVRYLIGESDAQRQQVRDEIFSTSLEHFRQFGDVLDALREQGDVVVMGSAKAIEAANAERPGLLKPVKVL
ncbi:MAG: insulinase family protein [Chloroflexaceae bacterium]|jgi:hypothetical protein|nr:insulinase family protein [Chloroflexaceae bacterium]